MLVIYFLPNTQILVQLTLLLTMTIRAEIVLMTVTDFAKHLTPEA